LGQVLPLHSDHPDETREQPANALKSHFPVEMQHSPKQVEQSSEQAPTAADTSPEQKRNAANTILNFWWFIIEIREKRSCEILQSQDESEIQTRGVTFSPSYTVNANISE
jgi:hypothetical protein